MELIVGKSSLMLINYVSLALIIPEGIGIQVLELPSPVTNQRIESFRTL